MGRRSISVAIGFFVMLALGVFPPAVPAQVTDAQRREQVQAAEQKMAELDKGMQDLNVDAANKEGQPKAEMNRLYEEFKKQQGVAAEELEELRKSTNEAWDKAKVDMDRAIRNLNGLYERSKAKAAGKDKDTDKAR